MAIRDSATLRNDFATARGTRIDGGSGPGKIRIYTGPQPADVATAASGTLLVEITLNDPSGSAAAGVFTFTVAPPPVGSAVATGTAGWARVLDSANTAVTDGTVGTVGTDFIIDTTAITTGQLVALVGPSTITHPAA